MIPLVRVVADNLHMIVQVAYTLIHLLIAELRHHDATDKVHKLHSLDQSKHTFDIILREMGVSGYTFQVGRESKK